MGSKIDESGEGWGGWDDDDLDLGSNIEAEEDETDPKYENIPQDNESSISRMFHNPHAMLPANTMPILSHEDPPASLISNVSGWGDDDGFGWGNEEDLPGNLRLSAERDVVDVIVDNDQKEDTLNRDVERDRKKLPTVDSSSEGKCL